MAERSTRPVSLRLRPSEHRTLLFFGDLIAAFFEVHKVSFLFMSYYNTNANKSELHFDGDKLKRVRCCLVSVISSRI